MKKLLIVFICFILASFAAGCGTYTPGTGTKPGGDDPTPPPSDDDPFTATLMYKNDIFIPEEDLYAVWTAQDKSSMSQPVKFENGVAKAYGLDGDYNVTLLRMPYGYTYNPNRYTASNDSKNVYIELYEILPYLGTGSGWYDPDVINLTRLGAYRFEFTEAGQEFRCQYEPNKNGTYVIESILDVTANEVNPKIDVYYGSKVFKTYAYTLNDGGASSSYTKNFRYVVEMDQLEKGAVFAFAPRCETIAEYPVYFDIIITRDGDFDAGYSSAMPYVPDQSQFVDENGDLKVMPTLTGSYVKFGVDDGSNGILDQKKVGYSDPEKLYNGVRGDGYYHLLDETGELSDTYVCVKLTGNEFVDFQEPLLSMRMNDKDVTFYVRGWEGVRSAFGVDPKDGDDVEAEKIPLQWRDLKTKMSFYDFRNADGAVPVTKEMQEFLQEFTIKNHYFADGEGWAEGEGGYKSGESSQWLVFCGYYRQ